jgi:hypothetical protein
MYNINIRIIKSEITFGKTAHWPVARVLSELAQPCLTSDKPRDPGVIQNQAWDPKQCPTRVIEGHMDAV